MVIKLKTKYLIIGAGISGLTFANYCDGSYIIVEKENEVGGYCRTIKRNGYIWDYAGHFFHFKTKEFKDLFLKQISDRDIVYNDKCTKILYKDKLIDFPFQSNIHQLDKEEFIDCLYDLFNKNEKKKYDNFLDMLYGKFGKSIVEKFLKPYNEKLYAINLEELDVEAMGRFFPYANKEEIINNMKNKSINSYNSSFLYPKNGAASFIDILYNKLDKEKILLNTEINKIDLAKKKAILSNGKEIEYKYLINTSPFNKFLGIFNKYDKLISEMSYNKVLVFNMGFDKPSPLCKEEHWIYLPDKKTNYYRIGFYNNILCNDKLSMYIEIGYDKNSIIDAKEIKKQLNLTKENLLHDGIISKDMKLIDYEAIVMDPAYVHINNKTSKKLNKLKDELEKNEIYSIGRYGSWTYNSMEDSMIMAKDLANKLGDKSD